MSLEMYIKDVERGQELMGKLKSLVLKGNWEDDDSKFFAQLLCEDVTRILQKIEAADVRAHHHEPDRVVNSGKKQKLDDRNHQSNMISEPDYYSGAFYSSKPDMPTNKVVGKNTQRMTNRIVIKQERTDDDLKKKIDDGLKWRKYGTKCIKNGKYPRQYYACSEKGCPVTKHVQRIDDGHVEIMYFEDHNCKQQQQQQRSEYPSGSLAQYNAVQNLEKDIGLVNETRQQEPIELMLLEPNVQPNFDYMYYNEIYNCTWSDNPLDH